MERKPQARDRGWDDRRTGGQVDAPAMGNGGQRRRPPTHRSLRRRRRSCPRSGGPRAGGKSDPPPPPLPPVPPSLSSPRRTLDGGANARVPGGRGGSHGTGKTWVGCTGISVRLGVDGKGREKKEGKKRRSVVGRQGEHIGTMNQAFLEPAGVAAAAAAWGRHGRGCHGRGRWHMVAYGPVWPGI